MASSRYELELKVSSARDLKNVNWRHGPNKPYAVVWVDPNNKRSTRVDESGDTEAHWDDTLLLPLLPEPLQDLTLHVDVVHAGSEEDTKPLIGSARLNLSDVAIGEQATRTLTLKRPSGRPHGKVDVSVTVREPGYRARGSYYAPPYGVPPPPPSADYGGFPYGPPAQESYYSAVPPSGYPYAEAPPPPTAGYGQGSYAGEEKKSKFGGMGTGLAVGAVAGALGGLALAEGIEHVEDKIADDAAEKVEDDLEDDNDAEDGDGDGDDF